MNYTGRKHYILYVISGIITTAVNFITYGICRHLGLSATLCVITSWFCAILFAFCYNLAVFSPKVSSAPIVIIKKFGLFALGRAFSGIADLMIILIFAEKLKFNHYTVKLASCGVVMVMNYILSRMIFHGKYTFKHRSRKHP